MFDGFSTQFSFLISSLLTRLAFGQVAQFGLAKDLIRISVGIEDVDVLIEKVKRAMSTPTETVM